MRLFWQQAAVHRSVLRAYRSRCLANAFLTQTKRQNTPQIYETLHMHKQTQTALQVSKSECDVHSRFHAIGGLIPRQHNRLVVNEQRRRSSVRTASESDDFCLRFYWLAMIGGAGGQLFDAETLLMFVIFASILRNEMAGIFYVEGLRIFVSNVFSISHQSDTRPLEFVRDNCC